MSNSFRLEKRVLLLLLKFLENFLNLRLFARHRVNRDLSLLPLLPSTVADFIFFPPKIVLNNLAEHFYSIG